MNRYGKAFLFVAALLIALSLTAIATFLLNNPSDRIIAQWKHPSSTFSLMIIERNMDLSDSPHRERTYNIYVGNEFPYGYYLKFPFYYRQLEIESKIKKSAVEWSDEGVTFKTTSGEILFIPKRSFSRE